jgi:hypothetical protein
MKAAVISLAMLLAGAALGAPAEKVATSAKPEAPVKAEPAAQEDEARIVFAQWHALYVAGEKVGYRTTSLYRLASGGQRLETNEFLRRTRTEDHFTYYKMIRADLDAKGRPAALDCRVKAAEREWHVTGKATGDEFVLARTSGTLETTAKVPLGEDLMFLSWTLPATMRTGAHEGETRRWTALDESLGGVVHDPCLVRVLGPRTLAAGPAASITGTAVFWALGAEQVAFFTDAEGRNLRSFGQSSSMVAVATGLMEARKLTPGEVPPGAAGATVEGLQGNQFTNPRLGYAMAAPPWPYLLDSARESGLVRIRDAVGEASLVVYPVAANEPLRAGAVTDATWDRLAGLLQQQWAARFEDVVIEKAQADHVAERSARVITGTARLGCTPLNFRNFVFIGEGLAYLVAVTSDRPLAANDALGVQVPQSFRFAAPEGQVAVQSHGDQFASAKNGFEIRKPGPRWKVPLQHDGPATTMELVRDDLAAVAIVRLLPPRPGQAFKDFVSDQAQLASDNLTVRKPEIRPTKLGGRDGFEIVYEGKLLSDQPARATGVYVPLDDRIFCLMLMARKDADADAAKELEAVRESVTFTRK